LVLLAPFFEKIYPVPSRLLLIGALVFFIFSIMSASYGFELLVNSLKIRFWFTAKSILPKLVSGFLVFLSIVLYLHYFEWGGFNDALGQKLTDALLGSSEPFWKLSFGDVSLRLTLDQFLEKVAETQLKKNRPTNTEKSLKDFQFDFANLPPELKQQVIKKTADGIKKNLEFSLGPLDGRREVRIIAYELIKNYYRNLLPQNKTMVNIGVAVLVFFILEGIAALFYWLVILVAFLVYKFALITGFAYLSLESRSREFILLS
jgi:hypothetical protein